MQLGLQSDVVGYFRLVHLMSSNCVLRLLGCRKSRSYCCVDGQIESFCDSMLDTVLACVHDHTSLAHGSGHGELSRLREVLQSVHHCSCEHVAGTSRPFQGHFDLHRHHSAEVQIRSGIYEDCKVHGDDDHLEQHD